MKLAKADIVPTDTNLADEYDTFADLEAACTAFMVMVNGRVHRTTRRVPADMLEQERARLHPVPALPHTVTFGETRTVAVNTRWCRIRAVRIRCRTACWARWCGCGCTAPAGTNGW